MYTIRKHVLLTVIHRVMSPPVTLKMIHAAALPARRAAGAVDARTLWLAWLAVGHATFRALRATQYCAAQPPLLPAVAC